MDIKFTKMSGAGNDFIMVDNRRKALKDLPGLARRLCPRRTAVGADGLIAIEKSRTADIRMRYINADGSEVAMCGNGARCTAYYAHSLRAAGKRMVIETPAGPHPATVGKGKVALEMPAPSGLRLGISLRLPGGLGVTLHSVNTGVPHAVQFVADLEGVDVAERGRAIRYHRQFAPAGTNANFACLHGGEIAMRTYERGVEAETLACGTGAAAVAAVAVAMKQAASPVRIRARSGDLLIVSLKGKGPGFTAMKLEGPVVVVYEGKVTV